MTDHARLLHHVISSSPINIAGDLVPDFMNHKSAEHLPLSFKWCDFTLKSTTLRQLLLYDVTNTARLTNDTNWVVNVTSTFLYI